MFLGLCSCFPSSKMAETTFPILAFFLFVVGCQSQSPVVKEDLGGLPEVGAQTLDEIAVIVNDNSLELARMSNLFQNLLEFASNNPCVEQHFANEVTEVMADGFQDALNSMKEVRKSFNLLRLLKWRVEFAKTMPLSASRVRETACPLPFFVLNGECIFIERKVRRDYRMAKFSCLVIGARLAEPSEMQVFGEKISQMHKTNYEFYVGGEFLHVDGHWIWQSSGQSINEIPWADGSTGSVAESCLILKGNHYKPINCRSRKHFICQIPM